MLKSILRQILVTILFIHGCESACSSDASNIQVTNGDKIITVSWTAASGPAPVVYDFVSTIDGSTAHNDLTDTSFEFTDLEEGMTFDASFEVTAKCGGVAGSIVSKNIIASTKPPTPVLSVLVNNDLEVLLGFNITGQADTFTLNGTGIPEGSVTVTDDSYLVEGLEKDNTYTFQGYVTLNGINSDTAETTHTTSSKTKIAGLEPWTFAIIMIVLIVFIAVVIVVLIIVLCCVCRRKNGEDDDSSDGPRKGEDGEDASSDQQQAWEYKDPYATVEYKVNEATRKRALAIAIQNAAIKQ